MLTVLEAIKLSTDYLEKKGIDSPRMNAELLLADILNKKRLELYLAFDRPLDEEEKEKYREYIARRGKFEPLQYITGKVEFFGLPFIVNNSVLIPRPETEILMEALLEIDSDREIKTLLDIGTGSGNIAVTAAKFMKNVKVTTIDISGKAITTAKENARLNEVEVQIDFIVGDATARLFEPGFDLVVSNPPYVSDKEYSTLQEEILNYEPKEAVTDYSDGYSFYRAVSKIAESVLNENGILMFELAKGQADEVKKIMLKNNFRNIKIINDYQQIERVIIGEMRCVL